MPDSVTPKAIPVDDLLSCASVAWPECRISGDIHDTCTNKCPSQMTCQRDAAVGFVEFEAQQSAFVAAAWASASIVDSQKAPRLRPLSTPSRSGAPGTREWRLAYLPGWSAAIAG